MQSFYLSPRRRNPFSRTGYFVASSLECRWFYSLADAFTHGFVFFWVLTHFLSAGKLTRHQTTPACLRTGAPSRQVPSVSDTKTQFNLMKSQLSSWLRKLGFVASWLCAQYASCFLINFKSTVTLSGRVKHQNLRLTALELTSAEQSRLTYPGVHA